MVSFKRVRSALLSGALGLAAISAAHPAAALLASPHQVEVGEVKQWGEGQARGFEVPVTLTLTEDMIDGPSVRAWFAGFQLEGIDARILNGSVRNLDGPIPFVKDRTGFEASALEGARHLRPGDRIEFLLQGYGSFDAGALAVEFIDYDRPFWRAEKRQANAMIRPVNMARANGPRGDDELHFDHPRGAPGQRAETRDAPEQRVRKNIRVERDTDGQSGADHLDLEGGTHIVIEVEGEEDGAHKVIEIRKDGGQQKHVKIIRRRESADGRIEEDEDVRTFILKPDAKRALLNMKVDSLHDWGDGAVLHMRIENKGDQPIEDWVVRLDRPKGAPKRFKVEDIWGAEFSSDGEDLYFFPVDYTRKLEKGGSVTLGFKMQFPDAKGADFTAKDFSLVDIGAHAVIMRKK